MNPIKTMKRMMMAAGLLGAVLLGLSACGEAAGDGENTAAQSAGFGMQSLVVDAETMASLAPGERLLLDFTQEGEFWFEFGRGPVDFSRIDTIDQNGDIVPFTGLLHEMFGDKLPIEGFALTVGPAGQVGTEEIVTDPETGLATVESALRREVKCTRTSNGGWFCLECWYDDSGNWVRCSRPYIYPPRSAN